jgi:hypothetical protein
MARPTRFPVLVQYYSTEEHEAAFNALAANGLLTKSDYHRLADEQFLRQQGMPSRPRPMANNGQAHQPARAAQ